MEANQLPTLLQLALGSTKEEQLQQLQQIKDAMTVAIINQVENETAGGTDCNVYSTIWYEANHLEKQLQRS